MAEPCLYPKQMGAGWICVWLYIAHDTFGVLFVVTVGMVRGRYVRDGHRRSSQVGSIAHESMSRFTLPKDLWGPSYGQFIRYCDCVWVTRSIELCSIVVPLFGTLG